MRESPQLKLGHENLSYSTSAKFLGITYDSKLTWILHLKNLNISPLLVQDTENSADLNKKHLLENPI